MLHGERDGGNTLFLDGVAYQPDGPVAQRSGGREQRRVHPVFHKPAGYPGRGLLGEGSGVVDRPHKGEVATIELPDHALHHQLSHGPQGEDGVEVRALVGPVVGVGPGEVGGLGRYLAVGAIAQGVVYIEAGLPRQVYPAGRGERDATLLEGLPRSDEREHGPRR